MKKIYLRNIIFGATDGLVSTVGLLAGIGVAGTARSAIIVTGIIYAFVEGLSMGIGSYLSEESAEIGRAKKKSFLLSFRAGIVMFCSFIVASFITIAPYVVVNGLLALWLSISLSLATLFVCSLLVHFVSKRISRKRLIWHAIQMLSLGGLAILVGLAIGNLVHI